MGAKIIELNCPGCGARVSTGQKECDWCHKPIIISTFQSVYDMTMPEVNKYAGTYRKALAEDPDNTELNKSIAMCYLKLKLYDKADLSFAKAIEDNFDDADLYLYATISLLKGKRPFLSQKQVVDHAIEYLNAALMIEEKGIYHYFLAYLKLDFYEMKRLHVSPSVAEELQNANGLGVSENDKQQLFVLLGVDRPVGF